MKRLIISIMFLSLSLLITVSANATIESEFPVYGPNVAQTQHISSTGSTTSTAINGINYGTQSQNSNFLGGTSSSGYYNYFLYSQLRAFQSQTGSSFYTLVKNYVDPMKTKVETLETNIPVRFSNISTMISKRGGGMTPEQFAQLNSTISTGSWAIVGTLWAVLFAVTWKG